MTDIRLYLEKTYLYKGHCRLDYKGHQIETLVEPYLLIVFPTYIPWF